MKAPEIICQCQYAEPDPIWVTYEGVEFPLRGALVTFYKMFQYMDALDEFWTDLKPYWWKSYQIHLKIKQAEEERKRRDHEQYLEQRRLKENDKKRRRRMEMKNGAISPENAVSPL